MLNLLLYIQCKLRHTSPYTYTHHVRTCVCCSVYYCRHCRHCRHCRTSKVMLFCIQEYTFIVCVCICVLESCFLFVFVLPIETLNLDVSKRATVALIRQIQQHDSHNVDILRPHRTRFGFSTQQSHVLLY